MLTLDYGYPFPLNYTVDKKLLISLTAGSTNYCTSLLVVETTVSIRHKYPLAIKSSEIIIQIVCRPLSEGSV